VKAVEPQDYDADNYQEETKKNQGPSEVRHIGKILLACGQQSRCFAKKV
jgi:hypothetical protein